MLVKEQKETKREKKRERILEAAAEPVKEEIKRQIEEPVETVAKEEEPSVKEESSSVADPAPQVVKKVDEELLQAKRDRFLAHLVEKINSNKSYPHAARRRGVEGDVEVKFYISANGCVEQISLISGKKIFKDSAFESIFKSFPVEVDESLFEFPKEFRITLSYVLK